VPDLQRLSEGAQSGAAKQAAKKAGKASAAAEPAEDGAEVKPAKQPAKQAAKKAGKAGAAAKPTEDGAERKPAKDGANAKPARAVSRPPDCIAMPPCAACCSAALRGPLVVCRACRSAMQGCMLPAFVRETCTLPVCAY